MDDDDKIRRNLVMASTAILILAWLDLPAGLIAQRLLAVPGSDATVVQPVRIWIATLAVMAYLGVRYRFREGQEKYVQAVGDEALQNLRWKLASLLEDRAGKTISSGGRKYPFLTSIEVLDADGKLALPTAESVQLSLPANLRAIAMPFDGTPTRVGKLGLLITGGSSPPVQSSLTYEIGKLHHAAVRAYAYTKAIFWSRRSIEGLWPEALALCAISIATWKAIQAAI